MPITRAFRGAAIVFAAATAPQLIRPASEPWLPRRWRVALLVPAAGAAAVALNELAGKPVPFLRWSFLRMLLGAKHLTTQWQVGDHREEKLAAYVETHARRGDVDDVIHTIDQFCHERSFLINVGEEKGKILDRAVTRVQAQLILELGTYCGYSALRMASVMPDGGRLVSVDINPANAELARRVIDHAGMTDRITVIVGSLGDDGETLRRLGHDHGFTAGSVDVVFLDHDKDQYVPDLERVRTAGWLHPGSVVIADNIRTPGAPHYRAYMTGDPGHRWKTVEHHTHAEYQRLLKDLVLESEYLGN